MRETGANGKSFREADCTAASYGEEAVGARGVEEGEGLVGNSDWGMHGGIFEDSSSVNGSMGVVVTAALASGC